jgi:hypothetical protein
MVAFTSGTFDTTNALSSVYLWIIFGYLASLLNCDLQRMLRSHPIAIHAFALVAFFFLFTIIDAANSKSVTIVWAKTLLVYTLFVLMTKSKWYFAVPVLALLLLDQTLKKEVQIRSRAADGDQDTRLAQVQELVSKVVNVAIYVIIVIGSAHYMYLQRVEYGSQFSFFRFFLGVTKCKEVE